MNRLLLFLLLFFFASAFAEQEKKERVKPENNKHIEATNSDSPPVIDTIDSFKPTEILSLDRSVSFPVDI